MDLQVTTVMVATARVAAVAHSILLYSPGGDSVNPM